MDLDARTRLKSFVSRRWPELAICVFGVLLRVASLRASPTASSFDFESHWKYIDWFKHHWTLPDCNWGRETFHPPLFYYLAGMVARCGGSFRAVASISVFAGCARLAVIWTGLELYLPARRSARITGLALAAVLPASVHLDGMVGSEPLSGLFCAIAIVLAPLVIRADGRRKWFLAAALAVALSFALLTKVSAVVIVGAVVVCATMELLTGHDSLAERLHRAAPWLIVPAILLLTTGWYFARNHRTQGKFLLTSFDCQERFVVERAKLKPYFKRRPFDFYTGWTTDIYRFPYYPSAMVPASQFFPMMLASTFADYYDYHFGPAPAAGEASVNVYRVPIRPAALTLSRLSVCGGTLIMLAVVSTWLAALIDSIRRRKLDYLVLLAIPLAGLVGQLHFATKYPFDDYGVVKGNYLQFAAPPLFRLFGLAVSQCWKRNKATRAVAVLLCVAVAFAGAYSAYCRLAS